MLLRSLSVCYANRVLLLVQLWYTDDRGSGMERHLRLRDQPVSGVQRRRRDRCNLGVPGPALTSFNASSRAMVHLDPGTSTASFVFSFMHITLSVS